MRPWKHNLILNSHGSTMIMVMIFGAIVGIMAVVLPPIFSQSEDAFRNINTRVAASLAKENIMALLDSDAVWYQTVKDGANNPGLACLRTAGATCTAADYAAPIVLIEANGVAFFDNLPTRGIALDGTPCNTYGIPNDDTCVFKFTVTWDCGGGACPPTVLDPGSLIALQPRVRLQAQFQYTAKKPSEQNIVASDQPGNPTQYHVNFLRGSKTKTISKFCHSLDGVFNQANQGCQSTAGVPLDFDCGTAVGPQAWFSGFAADGTPQCMLDPKVNVSCLPGAAVRGYDANGGILCGGF